MSIKRNLVKNTGFNLAGYFYLLLASFFSISILLHNLGRDVFGVYMFLTSFISLAAVFDFGISNAVIRKLSLPHTTQEERIKTWKTSFSIFLVLAIILCVIIFGLLQYLSRIIPVFVYIDRKTINLSIVVLSIIVFINHINTHLLNLSQAEQRFDILNSKTLLVGTANTIISAVISKSFPNIGILLLVQLLFHVLTLIFMVWYSLRHFPGNTFLPEYDGKTGKELFSFGLKNFVATLAGQVEAQFSNLILGALVSAKAITSFSIPQNIVTKGAGIVSQFAQVFFPVSTSLLHKDRVKKLEILVYGIEVFTLAGGVLAVFLSYTIGRAFLLWWLKDPVVVDVAWPILKVLSFYFLLVSLTPVPTALLQGLNKPQIPSFFGALTVTLEIVFSMLLIHMGAIGVAYAFLASVSITVPTILLVTWKELRRTVIELS